MRIRISTSRLVAHEFRPFSLAKFRFVIFFAENEVDEKIKHYSCRQNLFAVTEDDWFVSISVDSHAKTQ
jgi:hypothetical protein